jgi:hypothetical protein
VRWVAQQLAPLAKKVTVQYGGRSTKKATPLTYLVPKSTMLRSLSSYFSRIPRFLTWPASRGAFLQSVPHHKSNPTLWQCGSRGPSFFQLRSRSPRLPADPQIKVARPIVARFETKAITFPQTIVCVSLSLQLSCHLFRPGLLARITPISLRLPRTAVRILRH